MGNWTNNMKHFLIITNAFKDKNLKLTNEKKRVAAASALRVPEMMQNTQHLRLMRLHRRQSVCLC